MEVAATVSVQRVLAKMLCVFINFMFGSTPLTQNTHFVISADDVNFPYKFHAYRQLKHALSFTIKIN